MPLKKDRTAREIAAHARKETLKQGTPKLVREVVIDFGDRAVHSGQDPADPAYVFDVLSRPTRRFLTEFGAERIEDINRTTQRWVVQQIKQGVRRGESLAKIKRRLSPVFGSKRAMRIARTEVTRASNFASIEGFAQAGIPGKSWLSMRDAKVRETHADLDGQIQPLADYFVTEDGHEALYPGDFGIAEEDVNCRCGVLPVWSLKAMPWHIQRAPAWRVLESLRMPHIRVLARRFRMNLTAQRDQVLAALEEAWEAA